MSGFSDVEKRALACVLDEIIPASADGRLPAAGALGLADHLDAALDAMPELKLMVAQSLAALDGLARRRHPRGLEALSPAERAAALAELAAGEHAVPPVLAIHTFTGYYQHPRVLEALGCEPRPPHPEGYEMEANDLTLLEPVRKRSKLYRAC
jgi:hypothetical protein